MSRTDPHPPPPLTDEAIEALRGAAALLVVLAHYGHWFALPAWLRGFAFTGVDLFFVVSGFVFAPYLHGRRLAPGPFFVRRAARIYPLYALAVAVYVAQRLAQQRPVDAVADVGAHLLFLHTWRSYEAAYLLNPAFWSLPPEVEFYLALPLLAAWVQRARGVWLLALAALALHVLIVQQVPAGGATVTPAVLLSVHLPGLLVEFMCGMLAWQLSARWRSAAARAGAAAAGVALWVLLALLFTDGSGQAPPRGHTGLLAACAFALLVAALAGGWPRPSPFAAATAGWLGRLSYGVYLFHNAAPELLARWQAAMAPPAFGLACLALTVALAALLHLLIEDPLRRAGRRWAARHGGTPAALQQP